MKYAVQIIYFALFLLFWSMYLVTNKIKRRRFYRINHKIDSKIKLNTKFSVFYSLYLLDFRKIVRSWGELVRAKTVLSEGEVSEDTSREEKPFVAELLRSGDERALRKSSVLL